MCEKNESLFFNIKDAYIKSSSLCYIGIIFSALARGLKVTLYSPLDIQNICAKSNGSYRKGYHGVGHVFALEHGQKVVYLNKSKILDSRLPAGFSKKALKEGQHIGYSSPKGIAFKKKDFLPTLLESHAIKFPVVLKPLGGSMGKGVYLDINSPGELRKRIDESDNDGLIVEEQIQGDEYRIYFIQGQYYGAVKRVPAHVLGNGQSTVNQLIEQKNCLKRQKRQPLIKKKMALAFLASQGTNSNNIPANGMFLPLTNVLGRSSGGDVYDVSNHLPEWIQLKLKKLGEHFKDNLCIGLDVIASDDELYVIETNDRPQLSSLLVPDEGDGKNVADALVQALFPDALLSHQVGKGIGNIQEAINVVKQYDQSVLLEPSLFNFHSVTNETNDRCYHSLRLPVNTNRLMLRREANMRGLGVVTWPTNGGGPRWSITSPQRAIAFRENMPFSTSHATRRLTNNKERTKRRLSKHHISVPRGILIDTTDISTASTWFDSLGNAPVVVVKPFNGSGGKGVTSGIATKNEMIYALENLGLKEAVLEEHVSGFDYRLFVVAGKFKYAIKRQPAHVVGNGVLTVEALVEQKNVLRSNNPYSGKHPLQLNESVMKRIKQKGFSASSVLRFGEVLYLQDIANIGSGGDSEDITDLVHPDFIEIAERVYAAFNDMTFCGVDLITKDISQPVDSQRYAVIEVNANCDLAMHHFPTKGEPRNAAGAILDALFPESSLAPVISRELCITGKVQGVGYRKWFARQAIQRAIEGTVSNFEDGSVRAVVQGTSSAIDDLVRNASKGPARAVVKQIAIVEHLDADTYDGFTVV